MLEKILELMKMYKRNKSPQGPLRLVLNDDLSGFFNFSTPTAGAVNIYFTSLDDALIAWNRVFWVKDDGNPYSGNMRTYTFYWADGKRQYLVGESHIDAFQRAGYPLEAAKNIEIFVRGEDDSYIWDGSCWRKKETS